MSYTRHTSKLAHTYTRSLSKEDCSFSPALLPLYLTANTETTKGGGNKWMNKMNEKFPSEWEKYNKNTHQTKKKKLPLLESEYNENEQRQYCTKAEPCQHQYQKLQYTMWCLITRSLWRGSGGERTRKKRDESIDSIVVEARSVRYSADACANRRGSGKGGGGGGGGGGVKNYRSPFRLSLSAAAPSGDSRDIEPRQQKQISIRVSEREEALCWKGGLNGRRSLELYSRKLYSRVSRNTCTAAEHATATSARSRTRTHPVRLVRWAALFFPLASFKKKKWDFALISILFLWKHCLMDRGWRVKG